MGLTKVGNIQWNVSNVRNSPATINWPARDKRQKPSRCPALPLRLPSGMWRGVWNQCWGCELHYPFDALIWAAWKKSAKYPYPLSLSVPIGMRRVCMFSPLSVTHPLCCYIAAVCTGGKSKILYYEVWGKYEGEMQKAKISESKRGSNVSLQEKKRSGKDQPVGKEDKPGRMR